MSSLGRVLVTGADGFIGSHLTEALVRRGYNTRAFVYYNSFGSWGWLDRSQPEIKDALEVVAGDVRDLNCVRQAMTGCDIVMHLAALIAIPYSYYSPASYVDTNVTGTLNIVQSARDLGTGKVVVTSTSEVYGTARQIPISESHPLQGQSPYAASKIGADHIAMSFFHSFDTPVAIARPFNTYGPRQSARAVIPATIIQIAAGQSAVKLGSLSPMRDFNYVGDTVSGLIAVAESERSVGEVINLGSNFSISIQDTVLMIAELMKRDVSINLDSERVRPEKSEVQLLQADNAKALDLLGWKPEYGGTEGLRNGLSRTIAWFLDSGDACNYKAHVYNL